MVVDGVYCFGIGIDGVVVLVCDVIEILCVLYLWMLCVIWCFGCCVDWCDCFENFVVLCSDGYLVV